MWSRYLSAERSRCFVKEAQPFLRGLSGLLARDEPRSRLRLPQEIDQIEKAHK